MTATPVAVGPFRLVNPPTPEAAAVAAMTIEAIAFPWETLAPEVEDDADGAILVEWTDEMPNTVSGLYYSGANEIKLTTRSVYLNQRLGFVLAHEIGHMVDDLALTDAHRARLLEHVHATRAPNSYDGTTLNGEVHAWAHEAPHAEEWTNGEDVYPLRINEAFADLFVAAYAPSVWDGTLYPPFEGYRLNRLPRFTHWTEDLAGVRAIITDALTPPPDPPEEPDTMPLPDVPRDHPDRRVIARAVRLGLMRPRRGGLFRPRAKVTRADLARALVKLHDARR